MITTAHAPKQWGGDLTTSQRSRGTDRYRAWGESCPLVAPRALYAIPATSTAGVTGSTAELGNGRYYATGHDGSAVPVAVLATSGTGTLAGVASLASDEGGYCAQLTSGTVDCWGLDADGELGNGVPTTSIPRWLCSTRRGRLHIGSGTLSDVALLASEAGGFCALLTSGGVDCWGFGSWGDLGNGQFYIPSSPTGPDGSTVPVAVVSTSGTGALTGVRSLTTDDEGYCALLDSGGVDCWGAGNEGELGGGAPTVDLGSAVPVAVVSASDTGSLMGVASVTSDDFGYCALLDSGGVDCWGIGADGELGGGAILPTSDLSSAVPVTVVSASGTGSLMGVASVTSDGVSYCARLTSRRVDCWGEGGAGDSATASSPTASGDSAVSVSVVSTSGRGLLTGAATLTSDDNGGYCALLTSKHVDCWGLGRDGALGNGRCYAMGHDGSAVPVTVVATSGTGTLGSSPRWQATRSATVRDLPPALWTAGALMSTASWGMARSVLRRRVGLPVPVRVDAP